MKVRCRLCRSKVEKSDCVNAVCGSCRSQWYGGGNPGGRSVHGSQRCGVCKITPNSGCRNSACPGK